MLKSELTDIVSRILNQSADGLTRAEAEMLAEPDRFRVSELIRAADLVRQHYKKDRIFLCSIMNAKSGKCSQDCAFCAQSSYHKTDIETWALLSPDKIIENAIEMDRSGATHFSIVTSGHSLSEQEIDDVCAAVAGIREKTDLVICGSLGMLNEERAEKLIRSGMTRYHHNLETAESHFDAICTTHTYQEDIDTINLAVQYGFKVCSGGIFGLGETWNQRVEMAFTIRSLEIDTIPINFLNPVPGTRMEKMPLVGSMDALKTIALFRLINPEKSITICGGREITLRDFQSWVFSAGSNGLMIGNYLTTSGRDLNADIEMIRALELEINSGQEQAGR